MRPKLLGVENSGYGPLMQYGRTILKDRMLFGSAWPMLPMKRAIEEIRALPIDETIANRWLGENAKALLRL
jgi:predicted TIM-barrel fold metal-dependent hydrolase